MPDVPNAPLPGTPIEQTSITITDYYKAGEYHVDRALQRREYAALRTTIARVEPAIVRVRVEFDHRPPAFRWSNGTGVVLGDRRHVLTAAHLLTPLKTHEDATLIVRFRNGEDRKARDVSGAFERINGHELEQDWALLELESDGPAKGLGLDDGRSTTFGHVAILGFPSGCGRLPDGKGVSKYEAAFAEPLDCLRIIARRAPNTVHRLELVHGAFPLGGISGSPAINARGDVVGLVVGYADYDIGRDFSQKMILVPEAAFIDPIHRLGVRIRK